VREVLEADLAGEHEAIACYRDSRDICEEVRDYVTKNIFEQLLVDEEGHVDFIETQLHLMDTVGDQNYAQSQAGPIDSKE